MKLDLKGFFVTLNYYEINTIKTHRKMYGV